LIEGESPGVDPHLVVSAAGFAAVEPRPLVPGERGIELVLGTAGGVSVALLLPDGLRGNLATARLVRGGELPLDLLPPRGTAQHAAQRLQLERSNVEPGP